MIPRAGQRRFPRSSVPLHPFYCITFAHIVQGPEDLGLSIRPYALTDHIHERESSLHLSTLADSPSPFQLSFIPNVAPWFSGIISVLNAPLTKSFRASEISGLYAEKYEKERLCIVGKGVVDVRDAEGKHGWRVGGVQVHSGGKRVVVTVSPSSFVMSGENGLLMIRAHWTTS